MDAQQFIREGKKILEAIKPGSDLINILKSELTRYSFGDDHPDDPPAWLSCVLALKAASVGNFGVGSLLLDEAGEIVAMGHNEVFNPTFRSNAHAEMVVMDKFEKQFRDKQDLSDFVLYSSLESCPMCMTRLTIAGVGKVLHLAWDENGGMVHLKEGLPEIIREFAKKQDFSLASCSKELKDAAWRIFDVSREELDGRIIE